MEEIKEVKEVSIVNVKVPFLSMVIFMIKAAIASIPAIIVLSGIVFLIFYVLEEFFGIY